MADEIFDEPGREELIKEIIDVMFITPMSQQVCVAWAFLWHADLSRLQQLKTEISDPLVEFKVTMLFDNVLKPWICSDTKSGQNKSTPSTPGGSGYDTPNPGSSKRKRQSTDGQFEIASSPLNPDAPSPAQVSTSAATPREATPKRIARDPKLKVLSLDRDCRCIITNIWNPVALVGCHIYPNSLGQAGYKPSFWEGLSLFWSQEKVQEWQSILDGARGPEVLCNMITLNALAHNAWDGGLFALKHISGNEDGQGNTMQLQFHWLRPLSPAKKLLTLTEFSSKPSFASDADSGVDDFYLHDNITHQPIKSGQVINLETRSRIKLPLPSKSLIDLQWFLHRIRALSAGAFPDELELDDDEDDDFDERPLPASSQTTSTRLFSSQSNNHQASSISGDYFDDKSMQPEANTSTGTESARDMMDDL